MRAPLLLELLREPGRPFTLAQWDVLLRQASSANLEASVLSLLEEAHAYEAVPAAARAHFEWARVHARRHAQGVRWEVDRIAHALRGVDTPIILLKGGAYALAGLPAARGRLFSDIDILVPEELIGQVEAALMMHGWVTTHVDEYDQRYYRQWMHEIPPMQNVQRASVIDVHHAILPRTAAFHPDSALLRSAAVALPGHDRLQVFAPADMVIHSAVHLFCDGEFDHGMRDLVDLDRLLRHFGAAPAFWDGLVARGRALGVARPLFYALHFASSLLHTPIPPAALAAAARHGGRPHAVLMALMAALFERALLPEHPSCGDAFTPAARFCLYLRGNWLRMPPLMLARHLFHKAFLSPKSEPAPQ
jgi:hypothetical protein